MNKTSIDQTALAKKLRVSNAAVCKWFRKNRVPAERVLAVEEATGISRYDLRPDVFGPAPDHQEAA